MKHSARKSLADLATIAVIAAFLLMFALLAFGCAPVREVESVYPKLADPENPNSVYGIGAVLK